jgi:hypothetical protein
VPSSDLTKAAIPNHNTTQDVQDKEIKLIKQHKIK